MKRLLLLSLFLLPFATFAAGPDVKGITRDWGFSGPFGKYDKSCFLNGFQEMQQEIILDLQNQDQKVVLRVPG